MNSYIILILVVTLFFCIWIEYSVGGIIFRYTSSGKKTFMIDSLLSYLIHPFHNSTLWNKELLDVNYVVVVGVSLCIYYFYDYYVKNPR